MAAKSDSVRPPLALPRAPRKLALPLTKRELALVEKAMAIHAASRKPQLTWQGWHHIAIALAIAADRLKLSTDGRTRTPAYIRGMSAFLKVTGLGHLSKDDRACAMRLLPHWAEIEAWRATLPPERQAALNNPRETVRAWRHKGRS